ncbi:MAG TPA: hypothetical protein VFY49_11030 [Myxococcota bacterium]|nr:hypothetical protein [Myxococcota bacterium]
MAHHIRQSILSCGLALALAAPALAGDVTIQLDSGAGLSVRNSTGAIERLRVDEATGNISRNGALFVHTTGGTFVGPGAGTHTTLYAFSNSGFGDNALEANTSGSGNSAFGANSLVVNTTGGGNSAFGSGALESNTTGSSNPAFGAVALRWNLSGTRNAAFGPASLAYNQSGTDNTAMGYGALRYTTGTGNTAFGSRALSYNGRGNGNIAIGALAGTNLMSARVRPHRGGSGRDLPGPRRLRRPGQAVHREVPGERAPMLLNEMKRQRLEYEQRIDALTARLERLETC